MADITLETLAARLDAIEKQLAEQKPTSVPTPRTKDWRRTVGMFAGSEFMQQLDTECAAAREAERNAARGESAE